MRRALPARPLLARFGILFAALALVGLATTLHAQQMGPLAEYLKPGESPPWTARVEGDAFVLSNSTEPGAVHYVTASYMRSEEGKRAFGVDVEIREDTGKSHAGLIYAYQKEPLSYFIYVVEANRTVALYRRTADGIERLFSVGGDQVGEGSNRLGIIEHGDRIDLQLNGNTISTYGNAAVGRGYGGIVAWGTGTFAFKNYEQTAKAQ
jgi:hypothetical protein